MSRQALEDIMKRAATWPIEDQEELIVVAQVIDRRHARVPELSDAEWAIIDARERTNDLATDAEVKAFFEKYKSA
jgi:hypothetical protein